MRQVETDLNANRYQNALRHRDVLVDDLDTSRTAARQPQVDVQQDVTPTTGMKLQKDLSRRHAGRAPAGVERPAQGVLQEAGGGVKRPMFPLWDHLDRLSTRGRRFALAVTIAVGIAGSCWFSVTRTPAHARWAARHH